MSRAKYAKDAKRLETNNEFFFAAFAAFAAFARGKFLIR
jgi:hypothetical protein